MEVNIIEALDAWNANHPGAAAPDPTAGTTVSKGAASQGQDEVLLDALDHIDPATCDYDEWVQIGMALHYEGLSCDTWDSWSRSDSERYRPGECVRKWAGFGSGNGLCSGVKSGVSNRISSRISVSAAGGRGRDGDPGLYCSIPEHSHAGSRGCIQ